MNHRRAVIAFLATSTLGTIFWISSWLLAAEAAAIDADLTGARIFFWLALLTHVAAGIRALFGTPDHDKGLLELQHDWEMERKLRLWLITQELVDSELIRLATRLNKIDIAKSEAQSALSRNTDPTRESELTRKLEVHVSEFKALWEVFWERHDQAEDRGYRTHPKYKMYLQPPEEPSAEDAA